MGSSTHASTAVGLVSISKSVKAAILHDTVQDSVNANIGRHAIRQRVLQLDSTIVLDVVLNILLCGEPSQGTTLIYGYILLVIVLVSYLRSHMCTTQPEAMMISQGLTRPSSLCFETF